MGRTLAAHPGHWTSTELRPDSMIRNRMGRRQRHRGPAPGPVWKRRQPIASPRRSQVSIIVDRYRQEERTRQGVSAEPVLGGAARACVDWVGISRELRQRGYLSVTRRTARSFIDRPHPWTPLTYRHASTIDPRAEETSGL